jgi:hypothetical protein
MRVLTMAVVTALGITGCSDDDDSTPVNPPRVTLRSVEFTDTPAPATAEERAQTYSRSLARLTYSDGGVKEAPLSYDTLFSVKDLSRIERSMCSDPSEPADHIRLPEDKAGATYTLELNSGIADTQGNAIHSEWVATRMVCGTGAVRQADRG